MSVRIPFALAIALLASACSEPVVVGAPVVPPIAPSENGAPGLPTDGASAADAGVDAGPRAYRDEDFVELDVVHRDPFRDYIVELTTQIPVASAIPVKMRNVSLDQMRLIAIVTGMSVPYAMIVDPEGVGHVVVRGDYIGRQEVVNAGGADGLPIALNWKVDRIRAGEVVLTRADPMHPDQPPLMRSMLLRDANSDPASSLGVIQGLLGNTGDPSAASVPNAPDPGAATFAPAPAPASAPIRGISAGGETAPAIAPTPTTPTPAAPSNSGTNGRSGSRFGGVFGNRP